MMQPRPLRDQITSMFMKIAAKTISREEGALLLNDLVRRGHEGEVRRAILDLCQKPPKDVYEKTIYHTVALARNPAFEKILEMGLEHKSEDICIVSAEGLAWLGNDEAKDALAHHLANEIYHVRKASADVLVKGWGKEGIRLVSTHGLSHPEVYYRYTSALVLARSGNAGRAVLLDAMKSNDLNKIQSAAEALLESKDALKKEDAPGFVHALELAVNNRHPNSAMALLKLLGAMGGRAAGFEEYVAALLDYTYEPVRNEARNALSGIATIKAQELLASLSMVKKAEDAQLSYYDENEPGDYWTR